jgi:hypothetical protein
MIRATVWHAAREMPRIPRDRTAKNVSEQSEQMGADEGNRTRMTSLEGLRADPLSSVDAGQVMCLVARE